MDEVHPGLEMLETTLRNKPQTNMDASDVGEAINIKPL